MCFRRGRGDGGRGKDAEGFIRFGTLTVESVPVQGDPGVPGTPGTPGTPGRVGRPGDQVREGERKERGREGEKMKRRVERGKKGEMEGGRSKDGSLSVVRVCEVRRAFVGNRGILADQDDQEMR